MRTGNGFNATSHQVPSTIITDGSAYYCFGYTNVAFNTYDGHTLYGYNVVKINTDGLWSFTWNSGNTGNLGSGQAIWDAEIYGNQVFLGGEFTSYNGVTRNKFVALDTSTGEIDSIFSGGTYFNGNVTAIKNSDSIIWVGGEFTSYNGESSVGLISLLQNGDTYNKYTTGFHKRAGAFGYLISRGTGINVDSTGRVYIGGVFDTFEGHASNGLVRLDANGSYDSSFNVGTGIGGTASSAIHSFGFDEINDYVYIAGNFSSYNGTSVSNIAKLNIDGSIITGFTPTTSPDSNNAVIKIDSDGYIYYNSGGATKYVHKIDSNGNAVSGYTLASFNGSINDFLFDNDGNLVCVGDFTTVSGITYNGIVTLDANTGHPISSTQHPLFSNYAYTGLTCYEAENGAIEFVNYTGGSGSYEFRICEYNCDSGDTWVSNPLFTDLAKSVYRLQIRDANETDYIYELIQTFSIPSPDQLLGGTICCQQHIEPATQPEYIQNITDGSGGSGTTWYAWYSSTDGGTTWVDELTTTEFFQPPVLYQTTLYRRGIINDCGTAYTNTVAITMEYPEPWCDAEKPYSVVDATCSDNDGVVIVSGASLYNTYYDFYLGDPLGASYTYYTDRFYITAGWYALVGIPKSYFQDRLGDGCAFTWIAINNSDTTMTLDNKAVRDASCGTFGAESGRIVYFCSDTGGVGDYDIYLFNEAGNIVSQTNQADISQIIFTGLPADNYYLMVLNNDGANGGCRLLVGATQVKSLNSIAVGGIKRIFVTEWNNLIEYNYWTAADEDFYVSGLDSDFFTSIKIKEFVDSTLPSAWFEILMDTKGATYNQVMNKTKQGFIFTDTLTLTIPHVDNAKWKTLVDFLVNRYIIVFLDNNGQWWVMGYRLGAQVQSYRRSNNEYVLEMQALSDNKILTNLAEDYAINNIINS